MFLLQKGYGDCGLVLWNTSPFTLVETEELLYGVSSFVAELFYCVLLCCRGSQIGPLCCRGTQKCPSVLYAWSAVSSSVSEVVSCVLLCCRGGQMSPTMLQGQSAVSFCVVAEVALSPCVAGCSDRYFFVAGGISSVFLCCNCAQLCPPLLQVAGCRCPPMLQG